MRGPLAVLFASGLLLTAAAGAALARGGMYGSDVVDVCGAERSQQDDDVDQNVQCDDTNDGDKNNVDDGQKNDGQDGNNDGQNGNNDDGEK